MQIPNLRKNNRVAKRSNNVSGRAWCSGCDANLFNHKIGKCQFCGWKPYVKRDKLNKRYEDTE